MWTNFLEIGGKPYTKGKTSQVPITNSRQL